MSTASGLKVYRVAVGLVGASIVLLPIPIIRLLGLLMFFGGGVTGVVGVWLFLSAAPSGIGLGQRIGVMVGLAVCGTFLVLQSLDRWGINTPLMVTGWLSIIAAGVVLQLFWMKAAEAFNAWRVAEGFRTPMILGVINSLVGLALGVMEAPVPVRLVISGTLGLVTFIAYWMALSQLQHVLAYGVAEDD